MASRRKGNSEDTRKESNLIQQPMEEIMHNSIMPYAEYVIMERALPRVEDGLKPVQRRILYTMYELGLTPDKPHRKSARIVGDTLGKYHPHGDTSVYDAMVRMAQPFNMRELLVDGHGNFGSIDGDSAAAMRYTEARLTPLAMELLKDMEKDTVRFSLNFDDTLKEPDMLPGRFPNLLVNGASGIAIGLATNIPPHNLAEVIDGVIAQIDNPDITLKEIMKYIKGPDFPTGGLIIGYEEIVKAYETGRGKIIIRGKVHIENGTSGKKLIVITELPYQVNKANMLEKILKLSEERKGILTGIADIRDESDRDGMRAVIEVKKDGDAEKILNYLYKYSDLQVTFGVNMVAIADGKPLQMGLLEINRHYIQHQKNVVTRRTTFELEKARTRCHILEGLIIAIHNIDEVIAIIKASRTPKDARNSLMKNYNLTEVQAQAILDMRLQRLTGLEMQNLEKEYLEIQKLIKRLEEILASEKKLLQVIKKELTAIKEKYQSPRRTQLISDIGQAEIKNDDFIVVEDNVVVLTHEGFIKRVHSKSYNRSSRDVEVVDTRENDYIEFIVESSTDQRILLFTDLGNCFQIDCQLLPDRKWKEKGVHLSSLINGLAKDEQVVSVLSAKEFPDDRYLYFYTKQGMIKKSSLSEYHVRKTKIQACGIKEDDRVLFVELVKPGKDISILFVTRKGMSINIPNDGISSMGRNAKGVKAISLSKGDEVVFARQVDQEGELIVVTDRGFCKRSLITDYEVQARSGKGLKTFDFKKNGSNGSECIAAFYVKEPFEIIFVQNNGETTRINTEELPIENRYSRGTAVVMAVLDNLIHQVYRNYN